jgi:hypothetical protein
MIRFFRWIFGWFKDEDALISLKPMSDQWLRDQLQMRRKLD